MLFLGIDIGTGGSRAVIVGESGEVVASETAQHAAFSSPHVGWAEQEPEDWWRASVTAIRQVLKRVAAEEISAVSFSGQMHGSVLLDETDTVLRPALIWCDQRTQRQCDQITDTVGAENLIRLVSNPAVTGFTLPKLLWVKENEPDVWCGVKTVLLPKDYVRLRLSGDKATDVADASGTLLFDVRNRKWSEDMLSAFDLDASLFPTVYESIEATGRISTRAAAETGLREGTPVIAGAGDNAAGAVGMGISRPGAVGVTIGTSGVVFAVTDQPKLDLRGRIHTLCHAIPGRWHNTGVTQAAGLSLKWFRDNFARDKDYDGLAVEAASVPSGSEGAIWLPYLMGERTPHMDPETRAAFVGLTANHTSAHMARAILEGVAFSLRDSLEIFAQLGTRIERVRVGGGGARSTLWQQIQADTYGREVEVLETEEGAAFGAAILAGVGVGAWRTVDEACDKAICVAKKIEPNKESIEKLDSNYAAYELLYAALRPAMRIIAEKK